MSQFYTPMLLIVDYYEALIREIDVYTEELLEKYQDSTNTILAPKPSNRYVINKQEKVDTHGIEEYIDPYTSNYMVFNSDLNGNESRNIKDYLNSERDKAIDGIKNAQQHNLDSYKSTKFKPDKDTKMDEEKIEELMSRLFADKFCFLLKIDEFSIDEFEVEAEKNNHYLYIILCDFYLSKTNIEYLR